MKYHIIALLCLMNLSVHAQRINHDFHDVSMSDVLKYIQEQTTKDHIAFIYNELEDFLVTTNVQHKSVEDAILQVVGFYPIRVVRTSSHEYYVECTHKSAQRLTGTVLVEEG